MSRLQHALGTDVVKRLAHGYLLGSPVTNSDLARFRRHVQKAIQFRTLDHPATGAEAFRQALARWRGKALHQYM